MTVPVTPLSVILTEAESPTPATPACVQSVSLTISAKVTGVAMLGAAKASPASAVAPTTSRRAKRDVPVSPHCRFSLTSFVTVN